MSFGRKKIDDGAARLRQVPFFAGFSDDELVTVGTLVSEARAEPGAVLTIQGKPGLECFIVVEGRAEVEIGGEKKTEIGPGALIGEMALLDNRPRSATVRAVTDMKLLSLDAEGFRSMLDRLPSANKAVLAALSERVRNTNLP